MLKACGVIIWTLFSSLIAFDIGQLIPWMRFPSYSSAPGAKAPTIWGYTQDVSPWLAVWLLTWVAGIFLWIVLRSLWRRLWVPVRQARKHG